MEMLTNFSLILGFDLWHSIISWFGSWITNYGWAIIVFTIALKLVMSPLDIYQRISSKKQQKFQTVMQPELQAIQQKYANNKEKLNQEKIYTYQLGFFSSKENAQRLVDRVAEKNISAQIKEEVRPSGNTYFAVIVKSKDSEIGSKIKNNGFECYPVFE